MTEPFAIRLSRAIKQKNCPVCVGLDPAVELLPPGLLAECIKRHGESTAAVAAAIIVFNKAIIDAVADLVPAVKPQVAFYEAVGLQGLYALVETINYARSKGLIVIEDAKRNDIGTTAAAYAKAHLGMLSVGSAELGIFDVDAITINPYLGSDGIDPFVIECKARGKGIFILAKTSNPSSGEIQDIRVQHNGADRTIAEVVAHYIDHWGRQLITENGYSSVGAVVGATFPEQAARLREIMPHAIFLVPGLGAQGATARDVLPCFDRFGQGALVSASRSVIYAWREKNPDSEDPDSEGFRFHVQAAVIQAREEINSALKAAGKRASS